MNVNPDAPLDLQRRDFCCDELFSLLKEGKVALSYNDSTRELGMFNKHYQWVQLLNYCPWCGTKLPISLWDEWYKRLEAIGYDHSEVEDKIPEPYNSDKWWKDEGL